MSVLLTEETPKLKAARERLTAAKEQRKTAAEAYNTALEAANAPSDDELRTLEEAFDAADEQVSRARDEVERYERIHRARQDEPAPTPIQVVREPLTYERHDVKSSFLLDMARSSLGVGLDVNGAKERIKRHSAEMEVETKARREARERGFDRGMNDLLGELERTNPALARRIADSGMLVEKRAINRTDGTGGEFVPPLWLLEEYAALARAGRPFADAVRNVPLPGGTDSINVPRITTGSLTAAQTADNAAVSSQDMATATVTAPVRTIAGQEDVALQLLDQSPIAFDQIVFEDLIADYNLQLDLQVLNGSGASGQLLGILGVSGINAITYTDATPTVPELWPKLADSLNQASNNRKAVPTHYWMHGRRWFWMASQLDTANRPFFVAASNGPTNALGVQDGSYNQGGPVTNVIGVPVYLDLNIPTNLGAGTNEDRIIATRMRDHILFEGDLQLRALKEILSGTLGVRFQAYAYCAFTAARFPAATSVVSGTGLITPTF
jgi:HK97 family phage major capsid protein